MNYYSPGKVSKNHVSSGMSLLELLLAISMLAVFTGVVAMVMQFTLRFFSASESGISNSSSNGVLIDHQQIHIAMDALVEVLSQPGIDLSNISYSQDESPRNVCSADPVCDWGLENFIDRNKVKDLLPPGYLLCLWETTETAQAVSTTMPSIYLLQALPEQITPSSLATRRMFCRPRPFC